MPLTPVDFVPKGPVKSADMQQFFNLFTGVMIDQPVTFSNVLNVGGSQGNTTVPLKLYGAPGQTSHLIDLYTDKTSAQPGFGFSALGTFGWGPGGSAPIDTTLSRIATQNGGADTPGLLIAPELQVQGNLILHGSLEFAGGGAIADGGGGVVHVATSMAVQTNLYLGFDHAQYLTELRPGEISLHNRLLVNGADAEGSGLTYAVARIQSRGDDMPDIVNAYSMPFSAQCFSGNWLNFNISFIKITAGIAWPGVALSLEYDVDANGGAPGGRISMMNGKVGVGPNIVAGGGDLFQVYGNETIFGNLSVGGGPNPNSPGANLVFPQIVGPKICFYDAGSTSMFGMGIAPADLYLSVPLGASFSVLQNNSTGASLLLVNETGVVLGPTATSSTLWMGFDQAMNWQRVGAIPSMNLNGGGLTINGNYSLTWNTPSDPQAGGQQYRLIQPSSRPASSVGGGEVHIALRLYVDGDITAGTYVHGISFQTTSDPRLKSNMAIFSDANCMARIRAPAVPVYTYTMNPPVPGSVPTPNSTSIGFDATDVYANSPEFTAVDSGGAAVSVAYGQMTALLWGALRNLDARCVAKGI